MGSGCVLIVRCMLAAVEFFGVEWVGNETPALEQVGSLIGSIFVGAVAIFAAVLAAKTANKRQQEQLRNAAREQIRTLEKDQKLNNRDAFRAVATMVLGHCLDAQDEFNVVSSRASRAASWSRMAREADLETDALEKGDPAFHEWKEAAEKRHMAAAEARSKFLSAEEPLRDTERVVTYDNVRISVLIGTDSAVTRRHWRFAEELGSALRVLRGIATSSDPEAVTVIIKVREALADALGGFRDAVLDELNEPLWDEAKFTEDSKKSKTGLFRRTAG